jgi:hypothetical protein
MIQLSSPLLKTTHMVLWKEAEPVQQEEICSSRWLSLLLQALNKIEAGKTFQ